MELKDLTSVDWSFGLEEFGDIVQGDNDIAQCIFIIVTTQKGTDPLRPTFGVDLLSYIDKPVNIAAANLTRELADQINEWEPRVTVKKVSYKIEQAQITYMIEWVKESEQSGFTNVTYKLSA
jgi:phage baseplate assembly protein W